MSRASIFIVGPEGAGTTLLWECIISHPQLRAMGRAHGPVDGVSVNSPNMILHLSLPTLRPPRWVEADELPPGAKVLVVRRSPVHTVFSAYHRFYQHPAAAWRSYFRAMRIEQRYVAMHDPLCVFYEDLVHHPAKVLPSVYRFLGVGDDFFPPIKFADRNDDRWRQDRRFARFLRQPARGTSGRAAQRAQPARRPDPDPAKSEIRQLVIESYGLRLQVVDEAGADVCASLRDLLPPAEAGGGESCSAEPFFVRLASHGHNRKPIFQIVRGDEVQHATPDRRRLIGWLRRELESEIASRSAVGLFVHSAVAVWRGRAILLPGRSMSGKSSLVTELARLGATYYSDEYAVLDDSGHVHPFARRPVVRGRAQVAWPPTAEEFAGGVGGEPMPVSLIVSTAFRSSASWRPKVIRGSRAVLPIIDNTVLARQEPGRLLRLCAKVSPQVVTLQGPRPDVAVVAPEILSFLEEISAPSGC